MRDVVNGHGVEGEDVRAGAKQTAAQSDRTVELSRLLRENEQRHRALFDGNIDAVVTLDLAGTFLEVNPAAEKMLEATAAELIGLPFQSVLLPERVEYARAQFSAACAGQSFRYDTRLRALRGAIVDVRVALIPIRLQGHIIGIHCVGNNITEQKQHERKLQQLAFFDPLTGLPNRNSLDTNLSRQVTESRRFALLSLDLDRLKAVNETWGREAGDRLLKVVAHRLTEFLPPYADLFRYSGDDFVITYYCEVDSEALDFAHAIDAHLRDPVVLGDNEMSITSRIGISMFPEDGQDPGTLLRKADAAMFAVESSGRNRVAFYRDVNNAADTRQFQLEVGLRAAIDHGELSLAFQPQVDLRSGKVHGVEALLRWNHPEFGYVPPDEFIPAAEESGLIHEIGLWVIEQACRQACEWDRAGVMPLSVSVNISIHQFYDADFAEQLEEVLRQNDFQPARLVLEITESISSNSEVVVAQLHRFANMGVRIAIDDFGTGYSSLRYLKDFPVDYLKIDRSFIDMLETNEKVRKLVATITALARNFGLETIAEGTETLAQVDIMRELGADHAQGYYFSKPLAADALVDWLRSRH